MIGKWVLCGKFWIIFVIVRLIEFNIVKVLFNMFVWLKYLVVIFFVSIKVLGVLRVEVGLLVINLKDNMCRIFVFVKNKFFLKNC